MHEVTRTERLLLRRFEPADADSLWTLYSDPEVMRFISLPLMSRAEFDEREFPEILSEYERYERFGIWAAETTGGEFIGRMGLHPVVPTSDPNTLWEHRAGRGHLPHRSRRLGTAAPNSRATLNVNVVECPRGLIPPHVPVVPPLLGQSERPLTHAERKIMSHSEARRIVAQMNQAHRSDLTLQGRLTGGYQGGAWLVTDPGGEERVLKYGGGGLERRLVQKAAIDRLIARGYPTPAWSMVGQTGDGIVYHLQEFAIGEPVTLTRQTVGLLRDVIELQAGMAPETDQDWTRFVTEQALCDDADDSVRQYLRNLGTHGRDLVAHYDRLLSSVEISPLSKADLVHGDFSSGNLLIHDGKISGVVDSQALGKGTRVVDYAWLIREIFGVGGDLAAADVLRHAAEAVEGPGALAVCITATALDIVRWVQTYCSDDVAPLIVRMHDLADYLK